MMGSHVIPIAFAGRRDTTALLATLYHFSQDDMTGLQGPRGITYRRQSYEPHAESLELDNQKEVDTFVDREYYAS